MSQPNVPKLTMVRLTHDYLIHKHTETPQANTFLLPKYKNCKEVNSPISVGMVPIRSFLSLYTQKTRLGIHRDSYDIGKENNQKQPPVDTHLKLMPPVTLAAQSP